MLQPVKSALMTSSVHANKQVLNCVKPALLYFSLPKPELKGVDATNWLHPEVALIL